MDKREKIADALYKVFYQAMRDDDTDEGCSNRLVEAVMAAIDKKEDNGRIIALEAELAAVKAENDRLRKGLRVLADSAAPWVDWHYPRSLEDMAEYAKQLIGPP